MRFGSVCSGIEAASVAWDPLGWTPAFFSEIDPFARSLLAHHYPDVPLFGDFRELEPGNAPPIDLLVGGTPCQDFSVAGLRAGMAGDRGQLSVEFVRLAARLRPRWLVWENVPGVLSSDQGRAFGLFLGLLGNSGYRFAYRICDARYFGVPQRRARVFVVGYLGTDWRPPAAILLERDSLRRHLEAGAEAGEEIARPLGARTGGTRYDLDNDTYVTPVANTIAANAGRNQIEQTYVAHTLRASHDASEDGTGRGTPLVAVAVHENQRGEIRTSDATHALAGGGGKPGQGYPCIAFSRVDAGQDSGDDIAPTLRSMGEREGTQNGGGQIAIAGEMGVRRLTPRECERLMGFPDDYTLVPDARRRGKLAADQPRYHALGNSFAVPVVRWIGERIAAVDAIVASVRNDDVVV